MLCRFDEACWATRCIKAVPAITKMAATTMSNNVFLSFINPLLLSLTPHWKPYPMIGGGTLFRFNQHIVCQMVNLLFFNDLSADADYRSGIVD